MRLRPAPEWLKELGAYLLVLFFIIATIVMLGIPFP